MTIPTDFGVARGWPIATGQAATDGIPALALLSPITGLPMTSPLTGRILERAS